MSVLDAPAPAPPPVPAAPPAADRSPSAIGPGPGRRVFVSDRSGKTLTSDVLATCGLALFSATVAAGFARVFSGWEFFDDLLLLVLVGHGAGLVLRRLQVPVWASIPIVTVVVFWTLAFVFYGSTFSWGFPTSDTWALFSAELDLVREQFHVAVAPVVDGGGWDVLAAIGLALAVVLADAFAFGALARAEALVPGGVLFIFVAALGDDRSRVALSVALVAAGVIATVLLRAHHAPGGITDPTRGSARVLAQAAAVAFAVACIAGYAGSRIPGATSEPLLDTRGNGDSDRSALSPLVDIRSRLTNQRDLEMIVVTASEESYWRSATLAEFDGRIWRVPDDPVEPPEEDLPPTRTGPRISQTIRIAGLAGSSVPAAPDAVAAEPNRRSQSLHYDFASMTFTTIGDELSKGDTFTIQSARPRFDPAELAAATSDDPGDDIYLDLPDDFPEEAEALAEQVTAGATNNYERAVLLQEWFHDEFTYSLQVQQGHGNTAIEGFLRDRVGYCEQFAGTYAAMMRHLGIPARVAIGFTTGDALGNGSYSVKGRNAHAWPEVWFDDLGWVLFEPTPGRGAPGTEDYTGVAPDQADATESDGSNGDDTAPADVPTASVDPSATTTIARLPDAEQEAGAGDLPALPTETPTSGGSPSPWVPLIVFALAAAVVAAPAISRRVRRRTGRSPSEQLANSWDRAIDSLRLVGVPVTLSATPTETALVAVRTFPIVSRPIRSLAEAVTLATYAEHGSDNLGDVGAYGASTLRDSAHWAHQIERAVTDSIPKSTRIRRYFTRWS